MDEIDELNECFSVTFHNVRECYAPNRKIDCQFTVKDFATISDPQKCNIAILLVAWDSLDSAVLRRQFENAVVEKGTGMYSVAFDPASSKFQVYKMVLSYFCD